MSKKKEPCFQRQRGEEELGRSENSDEATGPIGDRCDGMQGNREWRRVEDQKKVSGA